MINNHLCILKKYSHIENHLLFLNQIRNQYIDAILLAKSRDGEEFDFKEEADKIRNLLGEE